MSKSIIGFIGCGNMGGAMIGGIVSSGLAKGSQIIASAPSDTHLRPLSQKYGITIAQDNLETARKADILFLAAKPVHFTSIIGDIKGTVNADTVVVSIAAGQTIRSLETLFEHPVKIIRAMPNTPALVGESMSALCQNDFTTAKDMEQVRAIFESFGKCEIISENLMDAVVGVSGSSPAYVYLFIEAMADAAVADGMPRALAYKFAAQSVLGAAKMVLETGVHPGELKDAVCSPGGTTIEAIAALEAHGLRNTVISAQRACSAKSREMGKPTKS